MSDSQRIGFWLAGVVLDLRFALGSLSGIFFPPFLFLSCVSKLGNTNKCYPPLCCNISKLSSLDTPLPLLFDLCSSLLYILKHFRLSGQRVVHLVLPSQGLWPSLGDLTFSWVRWKGSLTWNQMLLRLTIHYSIHFPHRATHLALCPHVPHPRRAICIPQRRRSYHDEKLRGA